VVVADAGEPPQQGVALMRVQLLHVHLPELALGQGAWPRRGPGVQLSRSELGESLLRHGHRPELGHQGPPARARLPWARRHGLASRRGCSRRGTPGRIVFPLRPRGTHRKYRPQFIFLLELRCNLEPLFFN
jgi:hypothetical protein